MPNKIMGNKRIRSKLLSQLRDAPTNRSLALEPICVLSNARDEPNP